MRCHPSPAKPGFLDLMRFVGWLDIWAGMVMLYQRGKWNVVSIAEEREKAQTAKN